MKKLPWNRICFLLGLSLTGAVGLGYCINVAGSSLTYTNSMAAFLVWIGLFFTLRRVTSGADWERSLSVLNPCFIFLLCFVCCMMTGVKLDQNHGVDFGAWYLYCWAVPVAAAAAPILANGVRLLEGYNNRRRDFSHGVDGRNNRTFLMIWGGLFLAYFPAFLASFPGFFSYDAEAETYMVFTEKYSTYQPLLHVLLLGWTIRIVYHLTQSYNAGIAVYILMQMAVLSACFAYMMTFLKRIGVRRWVFRAGMLFLALFPTVSMFVCCSTKDALFSGGVVLLTTLCLEMARDTESFLASGRKKVLLAAAMLLILFFRNNGIYALVIFLIFFGVAYRDVWKRWIMPIVSAFLIFILVSAGLSAALHAKKGPLAEMLCVPIQQLARVYMQAGDTLTKEEEEILFNLIPQVILEDYNPKLADVVKLNFLEDNFKKEPGKYIGLWFRLGMRHPDIYVNAFLENTFGYWYPDTVLDGYRGIWAAGRQYEDSSYFAFGTEAPGQRRHLIPALETFYEKISLEIYQQKVPVIAMLFSPGFWHWVYLFLALYLLVTRCRRQILSLAVIGLLYLTVLLGPIALVRYVLYMFFAVPLVLALLFDAKTVAAG